MKWIRLQKDVDALPPELKRKGRFDEIFCVNLPNEEERKAIFDVHIGKKKNKGSTRSLEKGTQYNQLIKTTEGFNGADIESVVNEAIEECFLSNRCELTVERLTDVAKRTISISKSCKKQIESMKKAFAENNFKDATTGVITTK